MAAFWLSVAGARLFNRAGRDASMLWGPMHASEVAAHLTADCSSDLV